MSFPYTPRPQEAKIESLKTQYEFLNLLRLRHLQWMNSAGDAEIEDAHLEIVELLEAITDQYRELLHVLPKQPAPSQPAPSVAEGANTPKIV